MINGSDISLLRLKSQHIAQPGLSSPDALVSWMGALQGQDFVGSKWSIGLRLHETTEREVDRAFEVRKLVRTWLMRGTLHIVAAADIRWMLNLLAPRILRSLAGRHRSLELGADTLNHSCDLLVRVLRDSQPMSRTSLLGILEQHGISTGGQRGIHILQYASLQSLIVQSEVQKNKAFFSLMDEIPSGISYPLQEEAMAELMRRYFQSRGPATLNDFAWWTGLPLTPVRQGFALIEPELVSDTVDGKTYYRLPESPPADFDNEAAYLLPGFDELLLGYKSREFMLDRTYMNRWCPGNNGMFLPFVVTGGNVTGIWKRTLRKDRVEIGLEPFNSFSGSYLKKIKKAAERYARFLGVVLQPFNC